MPIDIPSLIQDPEFRSLPTQQKRELLVEGDPEFSDLSDQEIESFIQPARATSSPNQRLAGEGVMAGVSPYQDVLEAIPFSNAPEEFRAGQRSGTQFFGHNLAGDVAGGTLGWARALATILNPVGKLIGAVPKVTQAAGTAAGAVSAGGDLNAALRDLTGSNAIRSAAEIPSLDTRYPIADITANTLSQIINEAIVKQPLSLLGLTPKALAAQGAALRGLPGAVVETGRNLPGAVAQAGTKIAEIGGKAAEATRSALKSEAPADLAEVAKAQKKIDDLQYQIQQDAIKRSKTLEQRNVENLDLEESLVRAQQEARALGEQALAAGQEIGPQIEGLIRASEEAPRRATELTERLPARQERSEFGGSIYEEVSKAAQEVTKGEEIDYSAVKESLPQEQPQAQIPSVESTAQQLLRRKQQGFSANFNRNLRSVIGESLETKPVDPLSSLSVKTRDIYERLPEAQKQSFLDQAGIDLKKTTPKTYTWDQLQQRYQDLNQLITDADKAGHKQDVAAFVQLKNSLSNDMAAYAEAAGTETKALFDVANENFAANRQKFGNKNVTFLVTELAKDRPSTIASKIVGDNPEVVTSLKRILPADKFQQVQSQFAGELFSPGKGVTFDAAHFLKQFEKIGDDTLRATFGEQGLADLYKIKELSESGETAKANQAQLSEFNKKAQAAEDAYQAARTASEKKRITDNLRDEAEAAVEANKDAMTKKQYEGLLQDLKKANTPEKISLKRRLIYGVGTALTTGSVTAGVAAAVFARSLNRGLGRLITESLAGRQTRRDNP